MPISGERCLLQHHLLAYCLVSLACLGAEAKLLSLSALDVCIRWFLLNNTVVKVTSPILSQNFCYSPLILLEHIPLRNIIQFFFLWKINHLMYNFFLIPPSPPLPPIENLGTGRIENHTEEKIMPWLSYAKTATSGQNLLMLQNVLQLEVRGKERGFYHITGLLSHVVTLSVHFLEKRECSVTKLHGHQFQLNSFQYIAPYFDLERHCLLLTHCTTI